MILQNEALIREALVRLLSDLQGTKYCQSVWLTVLLHFFEGKNLNIVKLNL